MEHVIQNYELIGTNRASLHSADANMLPRNLQALVVRNAFHARRLSARPTGLPLSFRISAQPFNAAGFHSSSRRQNELPKSPFQTFVEVLREELKKNRELQENVKQLQGDVDKFQDSEAMKKARAAYERARVCIASYSS
jgi:import inner membrane translocase subunit TIM44